MSFANTSVGNTYRPDRRILDSIAALAARVSALEEQKIALEERAAVSEAENVRLRDEMLELKLRAIVLTTSGSLEA